MALAFSGLHANLILLENRNSAAPKIICRNCPFLGYITISFNKFLLRMLKNLLPMLQYHVYMKCITL